MLPLDLHVLGLSLAFILSQDQTLRCKIIIVCLAQNNLFYCVLINGNRIIKIVLHVFSFPIEHYCSLVLHYWLIKLSKITKISLQLSFIAKSAAKVLLFFGLTKFSSNFFALFCHFHCKWLIFSVTISNNFRRAFSLTCVHREIGCKGTAFLRTDQILKKLFSFFQSFSS